SDAAVRQQAPAAEPQYAEALFADTAWQAAVGLEEVLQPAPARVRENAGAVDRTALMSAAPQLTPASVTNFEMRRRVRSEADAAGPEQGQRVSVRDPGPRAG